MKEKKNHSPSPFWFNPDILQCFLTGARFWAGHTIGFHSSSGLRSPKSSTLFLQGRNFLTSWKKLELEIITSLESFYLHGQHLPCSHVCWACVAQVRKAHGWGAPVPQTGLSWYHLSLFPLFLFKVYIYVQGEFWENYHSMFSPCLGYLAPYKNVKAAETGLAQR